MHLTVNGATVHAATGGRDTTRETDMAYYISRGSEREFIDVKKVPGLRQAFMVGRPQGATNLEASIYRLEPGATAWLVVQKNLGADSLQRWLAEELGEDWTVERTATSKGFRVLAVTRER